MSPGRVGPSAESAAASDSGSASVPGASALPCGATCIATFWFGHRASRHSVNRNTERKKERDRHKRRRREAGPRDCHLVVGGDGGAGITSNAANSGLVETGLDGVDPTGDDTVSDPMGIMIF